MQSCFDLESGLDDSAEAYAPALAVLASLPLTVGPACSVLVGRQPITLGPGQATCRWPRPMRA